MKPIRNSAKAIIIQQGKLLLTKNKDNDGFFYLFPGGGQEHGEVLKETLKRECVEELGVQVEVQDLVYVREYIGKNHEFAAWDHDVHQVEFYFVCSLAQEAPAQMDGTQPDPDQIGVEWVDIRQLDHIRLYPKALGHQLVNNELNVRYLGDVN
ncbi:MULTISPECIES: NUDIX domain-containing protein [Paenibacillus]|uniref:NUDIX domain-containing protein n=1 Tax=Paenibacillus TaxID=44249 RepID=UPI000E27A4FD|nr:MULTISPECIES: NUDIX domain-containing protein [Paenibacillus]MCM2998307.1 NUDIX domain-containing protein [Paenibacillus cellulositrophicus]RED40491.1 ADP-ribose pyrophosphatase YjhB (NUDIX family) [Paenibacillus sp. VMFN-D1]